MKTTILKHLIFLTITTYLFSGCVKQDKAASNIIHNTSVYGQHTDEIQEFLSATPMGSEIYLEEKKSGEWYLKIEKTFTVKKKKEEIEMIQPVYGESILI